MSKPIVAIVGRPNVGKSTLFNKIIGERRSIVEDVPGVTRDRIYAEAEWGEHKFILIDTGGIEPKSEDTILKQMRTQAEVAISTANVSSLCSAHATPTLGVRRALKSVPDSSNSIPAYSRLSKSVVKSAPKRSS